MADTPERPAPLLSRMEREVIHLELETFKRRLDVANEAYEPERRRTALDAAQQNLATLQGYLAQMRKRL